MKNKKTLIVLLLLTIPLMSAVAIALAAGSFQNEDRRQANRIPSEVFSYQGELMNGDEPETGPCDFHFGLWDSFELGSQVGVTQTLGSVLLDNGRFTVQLNDSHQFGIHPFDGAARYLAIEVDCPSGGAFVPLSPRQPLTPAPYSHSSETAGSAPWGGITSMPDGFADGVDDDTLYDAGTGLELITGTFQLDASYQLPQSCDPGQVVEWTGLSGGCITPEGWEGPSYAGVLVVAKSGGAFDTVQGALDSISDATSENRYLVWVAPGVYSETVTMKSYVDIEGAGENLTKIMSVGSDVTHEATLVAATHCDLSHLTVENIGGDTQAIGILSRADDFNISYVTVIVSGGSSSNFGLRTTTWAYLNHYRNLTVRVDGTGASVGSNGIFFQPGTSAHRLVLEGVNVDVSGSASSTMSGITNWSTGGYTGTITATRTTVVVINSGTGKGRGILSSGPAAKILLVDSAISGYGGDADSAGIRADSGTIISARNVNIESSDHGIFIHDSLGACLVGIDKSKIRGGVYSVYRTGTEGSVVNIGATLLDGNILVNPPATLVCIGTYDENYSNGNGYTACP